MPKVISEADYAEAERDTLAIISAIVAGDWEAVQVFEAEAVLVPVLSVLLNLLFAELEVQGTDPAGWVRRKQAEVIERIAAGGG